MALQKTYALASSRRQHVNPTAAACSRNGARFTYPDHLSSNNERMSLRFRRTPDPRGGFKKLISVDPQLFPPSPAGGARRKLAEHALPRRAPVGMQANGPGRRAGLG
jgi:hypothetical protein